MGIKIKGGDVLTGIEALLRAANSAQKRYEYLQERESGKKRQTALDKLNELYKRTMMESGKDNTDLRKEDVAIKKAAEARKLAEFNRKSKADKLSKEKTDSDKDKKLKFNVQKLGIDSINKQIGNISSTLTASRGMRKSYYLMPPEAQYKNELLIQEKEGEEKIYKKELEDRRAGLTTATPIKPNTQTETKENTMLSIMKAGKAPQSTIDAVIEAENSGNEDDWNGAIHILYGNGFTALAKKLEAIHGK